MRIFLVFLLFSGWLVGAERQNDRLLIERDRVYTEISTKQFYEEMTAYYSTPPGKRRYSGELVESDFYGTRYFKSYLLQNRKENGTVVAAAPKLFALTYIEELITEDELAKLFDSFLEAEDLLVKSGQYTNFLRRFKDRGISCFLFFNKTSFFQKPDNIDAILSDNQVVLARYKPMLENKEEVRIGLANLFAFDYSLFMKSSVEIRRSKLLEAYAEILFLRWCRAEIHDVDHQKFLERIKQCGVNINEQVFLGWPCTGGAGELSEQITFLVRAGCDIWLKHGGDGGEPYTILDMAIKKTRLSLKDLGLSAHDYSRIVNEDRKENLVMFAFRSQNQTIIKEFLNAGGDVDLKRQDSNGDTALHHFFRSAHIDGECRLIARDALWPADLINIENNQQETLLDLVLSLEAYQSLVRRGANIWSGGRSVRKNKDLNQLLEGLFPLHLIQGAWNKNSSLGQASTAGTNLLGLMLARSEPPVDTVKWLFNKKPGLLDKKTKDFYVNRLNMSRDTGSGPGRNDTELLKFFHDQGVDTAVFLSGLKAENKQQLESEFVKKGSANGSVGSGDFELIFTSQAPKVSELSDDSVRTPASKSVGAGDKLVTSSDKLVAGSDKQVASNGRVAAVVGAGAGLLSGVFIKKLLEWRLAQKYKKLVATKVQFIADGKDTTYIDKEIAILSDSRISLRDKVIAITGGLATAAVIGAGVHYAGKK